MFLEGKADINEFDHIDQSLLDVFTVLLRCIGSIVRDYDNRPTHRGYMAFTAFDGSTKVISLTDSEE